MTVVEITSKGVINLPEHIRRKIRNVRYLQLTQTKKGIQLIPIQIHPAKPEEE